MPLDYWYLKLPVGLLSHVVLVYMHSAESNLIQHIKALSNSSVVNVANCRLAGGCLQLCINLLQNATTRLSLVSLENLSVMSSLASMSATSVFFISKLSVAILKSREGQWDASCNNHSGPCPHSGVANKTVGLMPLEIRSAGLEDDGTCRHVAPIVAS